ncbi:hypothetical protein NDU88_000927 [Pleurodeles waltl]|uniref:Uncharacterized protein n=1 Tax=Pleurodeles waltl TaxID=8319 RepID=A0AAV7LB41_PLEWA|nr:hypothetical protein NDU88_000927 [Pleurodeles waltl]
MYGGLFELRMDGQVTAELSPSEEWEPAPSGLEPRPKLNRVAARCNALCPLHDLPASYDLHAVGFDLKKRCVYFGL